MTRVVTLSVLLLTGCPIQSPRRFHEGLPASPFQGVWTADETPRPVGIIVYELPEGPSWSPHGLVLASSGAYLTHDCRDFLVDSTTGSVAAAVGIKTLGRVSDGGVLEWPGSDFGLSLREGLSAGYPFHFPASSTEVRGDVVLDAGLERVTADSLTLRLDVLWIATSVTADGGSPIVETNVERERMSLRRRLSCP